MAVADKIVADLDVADATLVSGAVSLLPDNVGSTDAAQATAGQRPTTSTANGFATLVFDGSNDRLLWPRSTASNQTSPQAGIAFWFRADNTTYSEIYNNAPDSSSGGRIYVTFSETNAGQINVWIGLGGTSYRIGHTATGAYSASTWTFLYIDYHGGGGAGEGDKLKIYLGTTLANVASVALTFDGDSAMPATLQQPTDDFEIGNEAAIGAPYDGQIGCHIWCLDERATLAEVQELMAIEPPVALEVGMDGAAVLAPVTAAGTLTVDVTMDGAATIAAVTSAGEASVLNAMDGAAVLAPVTAAGEASVLAAMDGAATLAPVTAAGEASVEVHANGDAALAPITAEGALSGEAFDHTLDGDATLAPVTAAGEASVTAAMDGDAVLAPVTASGEASVVVAMDGAATLAPVTASGTASTDESVAGNVEAALALVGRVTTATALGDDAVAVTLALVGRANSSAAIVGGLDTTLAPRGRVTTAARQS